MIQSDHGPEFGKWFVERIKKSHRYTRIGKPNDNSHIERFNRTLQEECLDKVETDVNRLKELNKFKTEMLNKYGTDWHDKVTPQEIDKNDTLSIKATSAYSEARKVSYKSAHWEEHNVIAHIRLDDQETVETKHAKVIYEEKDGKREFVIYPIDQARVSVNGQIVSSKGRVLKSGDRVKIGSADLILFHKDLRED
jgi:hypothetical protein